MSWTSRSAARATRFIRTTPTATPLPTRWEDAYTPADLDRTRRAWRTLVAQCLDESHPQYAAAWIEPEWLSLKCFVVDNGALPAGHAYHVLDGTDVVRGNLAIVARPKPWSTARPAGRSRTEPELEAPEVSEALHVS